MSLPGWLGGLSLLVWLGLVLGRGGFWRPGPWLPPAAANHRWPAVAVVIPARNEAAMLPRTLPGVLGQNYPGELRIVLVDDHSDDATADAARALDRQGRLSVLAAPPLPPGWTGKLWALQQGVESSDAAFLLFTDADIAHSPDLLRRLVARALADDLDLVSVMARLRAESIWERLLIPAFVYFFALLYPFRRVNDPRRPIAAAAGGCLLVRRAALERSGGLAAIAGELIDDCALARRIKGHGRASGGRLWLGLDAHVCSLRAYQGLEDVWSMVARTAYVQLNYSPWRLAGTVLAMLLVFAGPPLAAVAGSGPGLAGWLLMAGSYAPMLRVYRVSLWHAPLLPLIALLYVLMTVDSARRGGGWKGRRYRASFNDQS